VKYSLPQEGKETMTATILVIEDDQNLVRMLDVSLGRQDYRIVPVHDGVEGLQMLKKELPDLVLLDILMPRMDGWETCRRIRELSNVPIIILTAVQGDDNLNRGLKLGADDYVVKPFSIVELRARIAAAIRRYRGSPSSNALMRIDKDLFVDLPRRSLVVKGQYVRLSATEFRLLSCFLDNPGRVLSHQSLLTQVWGWECADETQYLKAYIYTLRKKIEPCPGSPRYILTERGLGYRFEPFKR
jgi:two-component system, OmpR family, KDP operon response regulator KdpE